jgi:hypothetical protein
MMFYKCCVNTDPSKGETADLGFVDFLGFWDFLGFFGIFWDLKSKNSNRE